MMVAVAVRSSSLVQYGGNIRINRPSGLEWWLKNYYVVLHRHGYNNDIGKYGKQSKMTMINRVDRFFVHTKTDPTEDETNSKKKIIMTNNDYKPASSFTWKDVRIVEHYGPDVANGYKKKRIHGTSQDLSLIFDWRNYFLPKDYPQSVGDDDWLNENGDYNYWWYSVYAGLGNVVSSAAMVVSTQSLLMAVGITSEYHAAGAVAATWNWILKDGIGQLGGMWYASKLTKIDVHPQRYRQMASLLMDASTALELYALFVSPIYFLPLAGIANIGKNISFMAVSSSRAAIHSNFCLSKEKKNNLGDITAKATSQSIASSLAGTALGLSLTAVLPLDGTSMTTTIAVFASLSSIHQTATYLSLQNVIISTLHNRNILDTLIHHHIEQQQQQANDAILTPSQFHEMYNKKPIMSSFSSLFSKHYENRNNRMSPWLSIGCSLEQMGLSSSNFLSEDETSVLLQNIMVSSGTNQSLFNVSDKSNNGQLPKYILYFKSREEIFLTFTSTNIASSPYHQFEALYHAHSLHCMLSQNQTISKKSKNNSSENGHDDIYYYEKARQYTNAHFPNFFQDLINTKWKLQTLNDTEMESNQYSFEIIRRK